MRFNNLTRVDIVIECASRRGLPSIDRMSLLNEETVMEPQGVVEYLTEVEEAAEDVLTTKQQIIDLDMKRNGNREALNALKSGICSEKVKIFFGNMFIKFPKSQATQMIQKDQEQLDSEINHLRKGLKAKVNHLNEKQGKPELRGYNLLPLSTNEMKAIKSV